MLYCNSTPESLSDMQILKSLCIVLAETDDVVHPLLFACETRYPAIVKIGLTSLQKLIQYKAIPHVSEGKLYGKGSSQVYGVGKGLSKL